MVTACWEVSPVLLRVVWALVPQGEYRGCLLEDCPALVDEWSTAALEVNPQAIVLVHGGPVALPEHAAFVLERCKNCHGFYGASSMERLPVEEALTARTREFKAIGSQS